MTETHARTQNACINTHWLGGLSMSKVHNLPALTIHVQSKRTIVNKQYHVYIVAPVQYGKVDNCELKVIVSPKTYPWGMHHAL